MAYFWDVFDDWNDTDKDNGIDTVQYPLTLLLNWRPAPYASFPDFYADFTSIGAWGAYQPTTDALRTVNNVDWAP